MIIIDLTPADIADAKARADQMGVLNKSQTNGNGNMGDKIGEIAVCKFFQVPLLDTPNYDLLYRGQRVDVKTKNCTCPPRPDFTGSVGAVTRKQDCDVYVFARALQPGYQTCWLMGWISCAEFYRKATLVNKGEMFDGQAARYDCYHLSYDRMHRLTAPR